MNQQVVNVIVLIISDPEKKHPPPEDLVVTAGKIKHNIGVVVVYCTCTSTAGVHIT